MLQLKSKIKPLLGLTLALSLLSSPLSSIGTTSASASSFRDLDGSYASSAINSLADRGVLTGMTPEYFEPKAYLTRAQFTVAIVKALGLDTSSITTSSFYDTPVWARPYIEAAKSAGIINGVGGGRFDPDAIVTREQSAQILVNILDYLKVPYDSSYNLPYNDNASISPWAVRAVAIASNLGLYQGYNGNFSPRSKMTREQSASVIYNFYERYRAPVDSSVTDLKVEKLSTSSVTVSWKSLSTPREVVLKRNGSVVSSQSTSANKVTFTGLSYTTSYEVYVDDERYRTFSIDDLVSETDDVYDLDIERRSSSSVRIEWEGTTSDTRTKVELRDEDEDTIDSEYVSSGVVTFYDLDEDEVYDLYIDGVRRDSFTIEDLEDEDADIYNLDIERKSPTSVRITWRGTSGSVEVELRRGSRVIDSEYDSDRDLTFTGLEEDLTYDLYIDGTYQDDFRISSLDQEDVTPTITASGIGRATDQFNYVIYGTTTPNSKVTISLKGGTTILKSTTTSDSSGKYSTKFNTFALPEGDIYIVATLDAYGKYSTKTVQKNLKLPAPVEIVAPAPVDNGNYLAYGISGTASANSALTVKLSDANSTLTKTATASSNGTFVVTFDTSSLDNGNLKVEVYQQDALGNQSVPVSKTTTKLVSILATPTISTSGYLNAASNLASFPIEGKADVGKAISVLAYDGVTSVTGSGVVNSNGDYRVSLNLASMNEGLISLTVSSKDSNGVESAKKTTTITKDTLPPNTPTTTHIGTATASTKSSYAISGVAEPSATVDIIITDGTASTTVSTTADSNGNYALTSDLSSFNDGTLTMSAVQKDLAGNVSAMASDSIVKNTTLP